MIASTPGNQASLHLWRPRAVAGVTLFRADHMRQRFCRHAHDEYALGVITKGVLGFDYRRAWHRAGSGEINLVVPGEAHTGQPDLGESWSYRMFYIQPEVLREIAWDSGRRNEGLPFFGAGVLRDRALAGMILRLHEDLRDEGVLALEAQGRMLYLLSSWLRRHGEKNRAVLRESRHAPNVEQARSYLEECWASKPSLLELAARVQLSPYQLLRAFMRQYGLPPHAYLIQRQLREARRMLDEGVPIVDAAFAAGFTDQSHLHRHFKRTWGITPGQYCNFVQESVRGRG